MHGWSRAGRGSPAAAACRDRGICPGTCSELSCWPRWVCAITAMLGSCLPVPVSVVFSSSSGASGTGCSYALRLCPVTMRTRSVVPTGPAVKYVLSEHHVCRKFRSSPLLRLGVHRVHSSECLRACLEQGPKGDPLTRITRICNKNS